MKRTLKKVFNRHYQLLGCFNYERQMSTGYAWTMMPALKELYKDNPEEMKSAVKRHLEFYNCATTPSPFIIGISCAMEEQNASAEPGEYDPSSITSVKAALMGPLAGIGDSVDQGIVATIPLAIFVPMALEGSVLAAFMPGLIYLAWSYGWSWFLFQKGYKMGRNAVIEILHSGTIKKVIDIASIVGLFMIGCLSASYVKVSTIIQYESNSQMVALQDTLDGILPKLLPFCVVMGMYLYITKRGPKYLRLICYTMVIAIALTFFGII